MLQRRRANIVGFKQDFMFGTGDFAQAPMSKKCGQFFQRFIVHDLFLFRFQH
jgi:hypothetical protein